MPESSGLQVVLVEDNAEERWLLGEILRSRGHTVTACEDAESGWDAYQRIRPPLLLLDWMLPGMDGLDLCRKIRKEEKEDRGSIIIVVTGKDTPEALQEVLSAGADDYIPKPPDVPLLEIRMAVAEQRVRNIRERELARAALTEKTREMEALFQNLDGVFFSVDLVNHSLIQISPAVQDLLGPSPREILSPGGGWEDLLCPPELRGRANCFENLPQKGPLSFEYEVARPDGETRWVQLVLKPAPGATGRPARVDGVMTDITARKMVEEELSARNLELQTLNRISQITLSATNLQEAIPGILEGVMASTGFPIAYLKRLDAQRDRFVLVGAAGFPFSSENPVEIQLHQSLGAIAAERQKPVAIEDARKHSRFGNDFLRRQGIRSYVAFPLVASDRVLGCLALADRDLREIPLRFLRWGEGLANSLASFIERVEADMALRRGESEALRLAHDLRRANEELEAFAYSVSHDLRAPLRTMQGFAHALIREHGGVLPPQARDFAQRIIDSGRQSENLIRDLLAYSRMSFEEMELQEVDLGQAYNDALEQVGPFLQERGARIRVPKDFPLVRAHHTTMVQVLANLLSNAVKFVPRSRTPTVTLRFEERAQEGKIRIWVEDNGVGIPEDQQRRIFKVFERLEGDVASDGTGIGLAIVRRGMQRIGGTVGVESNKGEGSRFWLDLPKERTRDWQPWSARRSRKEKSGE